MIREIKFRSLLKDPKKKNFWIIFVPWEFKNYDALDLETICQYTGLKDKNGNEIYEGDILKSFYCENAGISNYLVDKIYIVHFHEGAFICRGLIEENGHKYPYGNQSGYEMRKIFYEGCEIIGNIYENSNHLSMLKEKANGI